MSVRIHNREGRNQNQLRGLFEKLMDSPYYSKSELCENVLQIVDHFEIFCLGAPFSWLEKPRNRMWRDLDCMADVLMGFHRSTFSTPNTEFSSDLAPCDFWDFPTMKRELRGKNFEVINGLQHVFEKWVERCKKWFACQGRYFKKETVTAPPQSSDSE
jgi:hypothetical protein